MVALSYITLGTGAILRGSALSLNGAVTLYTVDLTLERAGVANAIAYSSSASQSYSASQVSHDQAHRLQLRVHV